MLPGEQEEPGTKIAKSRIFQYAIEGSRYSKAKSEIERGIFNRGTSYFIVVHKHVKSNKSLDLNSNNSIFLWKGERGMNMTKNSLEKFITTPFKEIKISKGNNKKNSVRNSELVTHQSSLLRKQTMGFSKVDGGGLGLGKGKAVSYLVLLCRKKLIYLESKKS